jgi:hypothetical protein
MRSDFVAVLADFADVGYLGVGGLAKQPCEAAGLEQGIFLPVQCCHPRAERVAAYGNR